MDLSETGFHFEECGCWGMAAALHDVLTEQGVTPLTICYSPTDFVHAWVQFDGANWDYKGRMHANLMPKQVNGTEELAKVAQTYGVSHDDFEADRAMATEIVRNALSIILENSSKAFLQADQGASKRAISP